MWWAWWVLEGVAQRSYVAVVAAMVAMHGLGSAAECRVSPLQPDRP